MGNVNSSIRQLLDNINVNIAKPSSEVEWSDEMIRDLFDSIYRHYPIGVLTFGELYHEKHYEVLDGIQRFLIIVKCLSEDNAPFNIYFDLEKGEIVTTLYPEKWQVPVALLMSTTNFRKYMRKNFDDEDEEVTDKYYDNADKFSRAIEDYRIPCTFLETLTTVDRNELRLRLNRRF